MPDFTWDDLKDKRVLGGRKGGMPEMVFEYILRNHNIDPATDLEIDQSIDFGSELLLHLPVTCQQILLLNLSLPQLPWKKKEKVM